MTFTLRSLLILVAAIGCLGCGETRWPEGVVVDRGQKVSDFRGIKTEQTTVRVRDREGIIHDVAVSPELARMCEIGTGFPPTKIITAEVEQ